MTDPTPADLEARSMTSMIPAVTVLLGTVGAFAALLAVLLPMMLTQGGHLRREIDALRGDLSAACADLTALRGDLHGLGEREARIEGALTGPWRPPNGAPAAPATTASTTTPEADA